MKKRINFVKYKGKVMYLPDALNLATYKGKSIHMVYMARYRYKMTLQEAFDYVLNKFDKMQRVRKRTENYRKLAEIANKSVAAIRYRVEAGFDYNDIVSQKNLSRYCGRKNIYYVMYKGQKRELTEAITEATQGISTRCHLLSLWRMSNRYRGLSLQDAFDKYVNYIVKKWNLN